MLVWMFLDSGLQFSVVGWLAWSGMGGGGGGGGNKQVNKIT